MQIKPSPRGLFETITIEPLPANETLILAQDVLAGVAEKTNIRFLADSAKVALDTAAQYLGGSGLPGSALIMLKLSAIRAKDGDEAIGPQQILETLSQLSGLPVSILDTREQLDLKSVRDFFAARVIGQEEAVEAMVGRIAMLKAGLNDPNKPIGVFLLAGPTGTGKTELAKAITEFLFGSVERMIRLDMSEFQTHESIGKILSASADADSLINRVRKQPFSVLLLDEFEKSHPMIWDLFLQAFDEGRLTDAVGQVADLRHCLIILTSNLGASAHRSLGLGFAPQADEFSKEQVMRAIAQTYRPEFQNRLDKVIVFRPLTRELMRGILKKELAALLHRRGLKDRTWAIEWESSAHEFLLEKGFSPEMGARPLKRAIDQYVVAPLAAIIVEKRFPEGDQFLFVRSDGEGIQVEFVDPDADAALADGAILAAAAEPIAPSALASAILAPLGTPDEFQMLQAEYEAMEHRLNSAEWNDLKDLLIADMASSDFWSRTDRFATLARFALMDRVKSAAETANALRGRAARYSRPPRRYSAELSGRFALQLHLTREGIKDALENAPIELALTIEPVFDGPGERPATLAWCRNLTAMYRAWAEKRRMQISEGPGAANGKGPDTPILLVSGFGAHRVLASEAGLHVFEPSRAPRAGSRRACGSPSYRSATFAPPKRATPSSRHSMRRSDQIPWCGVTANSRRWCAMPVENGAPAASIWCSAVRSIYFRTLRSGRYAGSAVIHQPEMRAKIAPHAVHGGARREGIDGDPRQRRKLRGPRHDVAQHRRNIGAAIGTHLDQRRRRNRAMRGIDDDAQRRKGKIVLGGHASDDVGFHIDCGGAGRSMQLALFCRLGDR
jgi:ATP-dependent Clp protease ATP-binding subunit ClpC